MDNAFPFNRKNLKNAILQSLPEKDLERFEKGLRHLDLDRRDIISRPEDPIEHVFFPETAMVSIVGYTEQGTSAEVGVIGCEGLTGIELFLGVGSSPNESMIQMPGSGFTLEREVAIEEFKSCDAFRKSTLLFTSKLLVQISQTAVCNRLHSLQERLCRWLLMCDDRTEGNVLRITQEFLAMMVGSSRASVTLSAIDLQESGYIMYKRGAITVTDREGLEAFACGCYRTVKRAYDRENLET